MADEISMTLSLQFKKGGAVLQRSESIRIDVAGDAFAHEIQSIPVANTALVEAAAIGDPGIVFVKNLDATNFVTVGLTGSYTAKLLPGEWAIFRAAGAIFALADTDTCLVEYFIIEA